jgi:hypothetical protein
VTTTRGCGAPGNFRSDAPLMMVNRSAVPEDVRDTLCSRYDFILAEKEIVPNLTDNLRLCDTCGDWCPQ